MATSKNFVKQAFSIAQIPVVALIYFTLIFFALSKYFPALGEAIININGRFAIYSAIMGYLSLILSRIKIKSRLLSTFINSLFYLLYFSGLAFAGLFAAYFFISFR